MWAAKHRVNLMTNHKAADARIIHTAIASSGRSRTRPGNFAVREHQTHASSPTPMRKPRSRGPRACTRTTRRRCGNSASRARAPDNFDEALAGGLIRRHLRTVRDSLASFIDESGINYLAARVAFGDLAFEQSMRSLDLLTDQVFPSLARKSRAGSFTTTRYNGRR